MPFNFDKPLTSRHTDGGKNVRCLTLLRIETGAWPVGLRAGSSLQARINNLTHLLAVNFINMCLNCIGTMRGQVSVIVVVG